MKRNRRLYFLLSVAAVAGVAMASAPALAGNEQGGGGGGRVVTMATVRGQL